MAFQLLMIVPPRVSRVWVVDEETQDEYLEFVEEEALYMSPHGDIYCANELVGNIADTW